MSDEDNVIPLPGVLRPPEDGEGPDEGLVAEEAGPPATGELAAAVEAVLFVLGEPASIQKLQEILDGPELDDLRAALTQVQARYERESHGVRLAEVAGGWQIRTHPRLARWVIKARGQRPFRLSRAALETLAIVAYQQPVTRQEVEDLRGVDPGAILRMLVERGLVRTVGHRDEPGRPLIYGTTPRFLETFGLRDLSDLPTLRDLRELKDDGPGQDTDDDLVGDDDGDLEGDEGLWGQEDEGPDAEILPPPPAPHPDPAGPEADDDGPPEAPAPRPPPRLRLAEEP